MMNTLKTVSTSFITGLALLVASPILAQSQSYQLSGNDLAVWNLAGTITVEAGSGTATTVTVDRRGPDAAQLRVEGGRLDGRETLRVVYPDDRIILDDFRGRTEMRVASDGTFGRYATGRGDRVQIRGSGSGLEAWADVTVRVPAGRTLAVFIGVGAIEADGVQGNLLLDTASGAVDVTNVRGELEVDTGSGAVTINGADGPVLVDTGSGGVRLTDVRGPSVEVDTGSGGVEASSVQATMFSVDTGSGGVDAEEVSARDVLIDTGSGSVRLGLLTDVERLIIDTGSGGVTLDVPDDFGARVNLESGSGGIRSAIAMRVESSDRDHLVGVIGDGQGTMVIDTGSGGISIR